jgi:hypothetical protein
MPMLALVVSERHQNYNTGSVSNQLSGHWKERERVGGDIESIDSVKL